MSRSNIAANTTSYPWGVSIDGLIQVQPHNQSLPLPTNTLSTIVPDKNLTQMAFYLPRGRTTIHYWVDRDSRSSTYTMGPTAGLSQSTGQMSWSMWGYLSVSRALQQPRLPSPLDRSCSTARPVDLISPERVRPKPSYSEKDIRVRNRSSFQRGGEARTTWW